MRYPRRPRRILRDIYATLSRDRAHAPAQVSCEQPTLTVTSMPALDTGIGIEAGYASDADMIAADEAWRATLSPAMRELVERLDEIAVDVAIYGTSPPPAGGRGGDR